MPLLMVSIGLLVGGLGVLGVSGRLDADALRWLGMTGVDQPAVARQVGLNRALFSLVALSGVVLALGGFLELS
jgi:hypothetical protein